MTSCHKWSSNRCASGEVHRSRRLSIMEQLSLFDFPDDPIFLKAPVAIPGKWDAWWLELLCHPRDEWEDADDEAVARSRGLAAKQERIPGLDVTGSDHFGL